MIKHIDGYHVAAQVRFLRQQHKGTILLLEGDTDAKALDKFCDPAACQTEVTFGKPNLLKALDLLEDEGITGVLALADSDFDKIFHVKHALDNLYLTDLHDFDLTIFYSQALNRYLREYVDKHLFERNFDSDVDKVRRSVFDSCLPLAYCRLASDQSPVKLDFKDLSLDSFVNVATLKIDTDALLPHILARCGAAMNVERLKKLSDDASAIKCDPLQVLNGHDVCEVLGIALRRLLANRRNDQTWGKEIEAGLRLTFDWDTFSNTEVYRDFRRWEAKSSPYRIFPLDRATLA